MDFIGADYLSKHTKEIFFSLFPCENTFLKLYLLIFIVFVLGILTFYLVEGHNALNFIPPSD